MPQTKLAPYWQICDYCGSEYDEARQGHQHNQDCECEHCDTHDERFMGYGFCGAECEMHFLLEELHKTKERQYSTSLEESILKKKRWNQLIKRSFIFMAKESGKSNKAALRLKKRLATAKKALKFYSDQKQLEPEDDKTEDQNNEPIDNGETAEE